MDKAANGNIRLHWNHTLEEVLGDASGVTGVRLKSTLTGEENKLDLAGVFIAVGHKPNTDLFQGQLEMRSEEHTSELQSLMRTSYAVFCLKKNMTARSALSLTTRMHTPIS